MNGKETEQTIIAPTEKVTEYPVFPICNHLIQIQHFNIRLNSDPDPDPIRIQGFDDQKLKKIYGWKKI
jgi:hypothetical protein